MMVARVVAVLALAIGPASAQEPRDVTDETLADAKALARLQRTGKVLFRSGFEGKDPLAPYFEVRGRKDGRASIDSEVHRGGKASLRLVAPARDGAASGSGASAWLGKTGHERVSFRRFIRFADDYDQGNLHHVGGGLAAVSGSGKWDGMGKAGVRPKGDDRFTVAFEPWRDWGRRPAPGYMFCYAYWVDMKKSRDGNWWGNNLAPVAARRVVPKRGRWTCLEHLLQANTPGKADGELACWVDGRLVLHMTGFRWRTSEKVRIKRFDLGLYVHSARRTNTVWYDDVVVSTGHVGPD